MKTKIYKKAKVVLTLDAMNIHARSKAEAKRELKEFLESNSNIFVRNKLSITSIS